jgi:eukaryotic-like serine/threonine-protein kinase
VNPRGAVESAGAHAMIGQIIADRYHIEQRIGHGGMGAVYRARHVKIGRAFAVKLLHPDLITNEKMRRRFVREAQLAGTLRHPNVIGVVDVGETPEGVYYIVMEYADGPTLHEIISAGPSSGPRTVAIVKQLCDGLYHAHERGLIHRDFKPENVIVECDHDGFERPRIVDFGIAIVRDPSSNQRERLTTEGLVLGTPHYMAPEHATDAQIDHRIDLFALGVIMYEMLTGVMPFEGSGVEVVRANIMQETPAMASRAPDIEVDPLLEAFTRRLLAKSRDARPATAKVARDLLGLITRDREAAARQLGAPVPSARFAVRHPSVTPPAGLQPRGGSADDMLDTEVSTPAFAFTERVRVRSAISLAPTQLAIALGGAAVILAALLAFVLQY